MGEFNRSGSRDRGGRGSHRGGGRGGGHGGGFRGDFGPRQMHKATCAECGQECEVPFKPTEGKPVYCRECYRKRRSF